MFVLVRDNNVDSALRLLKKKLQRGGIFREMKSRRYYKKPSELKVEKHEETRRRIKKYLRKRLEVEGF